jgi:hypothetical protein
MAWAGNEYVIAANVTGKGSALLPKGKWTVKMYDVIAMKETKLAENASGKFNFEFTDSRAQLIHFKKVK